MPTYEYRCPDGHDFEKFVQKISLASAELPCPVCGKVAQRRISAGGGLVFKGSGFYITDYGKDGKKDLRANAAAASSGDNKSSGANADAAPAAAASSDGDTPKRDTSPRDTPKRDVPQADMPKSSGAKGDAPAAAPSAPKSPGTEK
jgi:putative FmdB family regulatory protein